MNLLWFIAGIASGFLLYHQLVPWVMKRLGRDKEVLVKMVQNLNHDAFVNLRGAVDEEARRRDSQTY